MKEDSKVMIFENQTHFFILSLETQYKWSKREIKVVDETTDAKCIEASWPKITKFAENKFFLSGGSKNNQGSKACYILHTQYGRLEKIQELPVPKLAH